MNDESTSESEASGVILGKADGPGIVRSLSPAAVSRRHMLMGAALLGTAGLAFARQPKRLAPRMPNDQFEALFPKAFGPWKIQPASELIVPPESELADKLYEHILTRTYSGPNDVSVMLLIAYSSAQIDDVQLHRPEICYYASGFQIAEKSPHEFNIDAQHKIPGCVVVANRSFRSETVLYWTRVGEFFPFDWKEQRFAMMAANVQGFYPDGILARASIIEGKERSLPILEKFYRDLAQACSTPARKLLYMT
jgi:EpsI family protein